MKCKIIIVFFLWSFCLNAGVRIITANPHPTVALDTPSGLASQGV